MTSKKKKYTEKPPKPEDDRNNVTYYRKKAMLNRKPETTIRNGSIVTAYKIAQEKTISTMTITQDIVTGSSSTSKSWSQIAGVNVRKSATEKSTQKKPTKIKPEFESDTSGYDIKS